MEKLSVMIVDDEQWIARLVEALIHWDELEMSLQGTFYDGMEAFQHIISEKPDIVISDIKMPMMDGLEMISKVRQEGMGTKFILLSGYSDFEYAQAALKYGVVDYLLKPVNEKELNDILMKIKKRCEQEFAKNKEEFELREKVKANRSLVEKEFLLALMKQEALNVEVLEQSYFVQIPEAEIRAFCVKLDCFNLEEIEESESLFIIRNIINSLGEYFNSISAHWIISDFPNLKILGALNYKDVSDRDIEQDFSRWMADIKNYIYSFQNYEITVSLSDEYKKNRISEALKKSEEMIRERIIIGSGKLITEKSIKKRNILNEKDLFDIFRNSFVNALHSFQSIQVYRIIDQIYDRIERENGDAAAYYHLSELLFITCINAYAIELKDAQREFTEKIKICRSRTDIKKVLKKYIKTYMDQAENEKKQLSYLPVRKAMEYVENNYMDKIGLEEIAEYVGLNASYFSALFKKESGKTFLSYLTEIRINHAKEFLRTTNDTMGSIAEKVGYTDARYFSQCFEKIVGMKPSLFRKLYAK